MRGLHRANDDQRRQAVRQDVAEHDPCVAQSEATRRFDVLLLALDQRRTADRARIVGPLHRNERDDDLVDALAEDRDQHQRDQDRWKGKLKVDDTHDDRLDPPADVGREQPDAGPDHHRQKAGEHTDRERDPEPVEDGAVQVAPGAVGAQPERVAVKTFRTGRLTGIQNGHLREVIGVLRRDPGRQQGEQYDHRKQHQRERRDGAFKILRNKALEGRFGLAAASRCLSLARSVFDFITRLVGRRHDFCPPRRTRGSSSE